MLTEQNIKKPRKRIIVKHNYVGLWSMELQILELTGDSHIISTVNTNFVLLTIQMNDLNYSGVKPGDMKAPCGMCCQRLWAEFAT